MQEWSRVVLEIVDGVPVPRDQLLMLLGLSLMAGVVIAIGIVVFFRGKGGPKLTRTQLQKNDKRIRNETYQKARSAIRNEILPKLATSGAIVIEIIHDTDWEKFFREEAPRNISFDEVFEAMRRLEAAKNMDVLLVLHTLGGYSLPSIMLADAVRKHRDRGGKVTAFVPYIAMSGGTILALASDDVWMSNVARLGPIDTQFGSISGHALRHLSDHKPSEKQADDILLFKIEAEKYESYYEAELKRLVDWDALDRRVFDGTLSHSHAFNREDAEGFGIRTIPRAKFPDRRRKSVEDMAKLARQLVDARLSMIKNSYQRDDEDEETTSAEVPKIVVSKAA